MLSYIYILYNLTYNLHITSDGKPQKKIKKPDLKQPCWKQPHFKFLLLALQGCFQLVDCIGRVLIFDASQVLRKVAKRPIWTSRMSEIETSRNMYQQKLS